MNYNKKSCYKTSPNIALIKYWGKYNENLIIPLNSSISITLSSVLKHLFIQNVLSSETIVIIDSEYKSDELLINNMYFNILNRKQDLSNNKRILNLLNTFRSIAKDDMYIFVIIVINMEI